MDSPHIDRIVFGRHFRRQDSSDGLDATTTRNAGLPGLTDILGRPTRTTATIAPTSTATSSDPAETTESTTTTSAGETSTTSTTSQTSTSTETQPAETSSTTSTQQTPTETANAGNAGQQQPNTTSTELVIESKTVTNSAPQQSNTVAVGNMGASSKNAFLENKVASGIVFGICGLVGLLLILGIVWLALRKRRRIRQLEKEIISFDPEHVGGFHQTRRDGDVASVNSMEKAARSNSSLDQYAGAGYAPTMHSNQGGGYRDAAPYSDYPQMQRQDSLQRPGNAAFNATSGAGAPPGLYSMPPQTFNRLS